MSVQVVRGSAAGSLMRAKRLIGDTSAEETSDCAPPGGINSGFPLLQRCGEPGNKARSMTTSSIPIACRRSD
jgi:hypothetical protein